MELEGFVREELLRLSLHPQAREAVLRLSQALLREPQTLRNSVAVLAAASEAMEKARRSGQGRGGSGQDVSAHEESIIRVARGIAELRSSDEDVLARFFSPQELVDPDAEPAVRYERREVTPELEARYIKPQHTGGLWWVLVAAAVLALAGLGWYAVGRLTETAPVAEVQKARLRVESTPPGARVLVNDVDRGVTPLQLEALPADSVQVVRVVMEGRAPGLKAVILKPGDNVLQVSLELAAGRLFVTAKPAGAKVFANGSLVGVAPMSVALAPGKYRVEVRAEGRKAVGKDVVLQPGRDVKLAFALAPGSVTEEAPPVAPPTRVVNVAPGVPAGGTWRPGQPAPSGGVPAVGGAPTLSVSPGAVSVMVPAGGSLDEVFRVSSDSAVGFRLTRQMVQPGVLFSGGGGQLRPGMAVPVGIEVTPYTSPGVYEGTVGVQDVTTGRTVEVQVRVEVTPRR